MQNYQIKELFSKEQLNARVKELAIEIKKDYKGDAPLVLVGLLKGSFVFIADLLRELNESDITIDFMVASSYTNKMETSRNVRILKDLDNDIKDKHVILVEDIIDSGYTLSTVVELLKSREAKSLKICTLFDKPNRREVNVRVDYTGFSIEDYFIVGYGIDYAEKYRGLSYVARVITK